jgi:hypothetical protein
MQCYHCNLITCRMRVKSDGPATWRRGSNDTAMSTPPGKTRWSGCDPARENFPNCEAPHRQRDAAALHSPAIGHWRPVQRGAAAMGKKMPLKWIEQAEARQVCVMAISERRPMPRPPVVATSLRSSLVRLRSWIAPPNQDGDDNQPAPPLSAGIVRVRRARRTAN